MLTRPRYRAPLRRNLFVALSVLFGGTIGWATIHLAAPKGASIAHAIDGWEPSPVYVDSNITDGWDQPSAYVNSNITVNTLNGHGTTSGTIEYVGWYLDVRNAPVPVYVDYSAPWFNRW